MENTITLPKNGNFAVGLFYGLLFGVILWALIIFVIVTVIRTEECREYPLSVYGSEASRYVLMEPCKTITGQIIMMIEESPEMGGEKHLYLWYESGNGDNMTDVEFAEPWLIPSLSDLSHIQQATVMGALVYDKTRSRYSIKPAWQLYEYIRQYNEQRSDGWYRVTQWRDDWSEVWINPDDYATAGIPN